MATRIRDIVVELRRAGFRETGRGKGSHRQFRHDASGVTATICGKDGDDAKPYLIKQVRAKISEATVVGE
ncbi:MAG: type II toxin-antitoxin system HicA family toxin [Akkermansia sp.]